VVPPLDRIENAGPETGDARGTARVSHQPEPADPEARRLAGYAPLPSGIDLLLTDACNLRCTYCPITTDAKVRRPAAVMDTDKAMRLLGEVATFRPMIRVFGGEPFLHPEWERIFACAVGHGLPLTVVTNATRLVGQAETLIRSGLLAVGISIDPPVANDSFRGSGTFATCERVVHEIHAARRRLGSPTPLIEIYTTVYAGTYDALIAWAHTLAGWGIDTLRIQHQIWLRTDQRPPSEALIAAAIGDSTFFRSDVDTYCSDVMPAVDLAVLEEQLRGLERGPWPFTLECHPPLPVAEMLAYYRDPGFRRRTQRPCTLISHYSFVDPRGRLYPCLTLDMGNVFEQPFESVWNGERYRAFRRLLQRHERLPLCERCPA
jgi:MoaA/NifB/PqqE/SkfB family radical SAM enzyme